MRTGLVLPLSAALRRAVQRLPEADNSREFQRHSLRLGLPFTQFHL